MATRNIVPRGDGEGSLGTSAKMWGEVYAKRIEAEAIAGFNFRKASTSYSSKDIAFLTALPTGWYIECKTAGETGSGTITLPSPIVENATVTDGTVTWKIRKISSADGVPLGIILPFASNGDIPSGYLLCDGAAVSRTMYPDLFALIGTDYGAGDGSTTFNLPNLIGKFAEGAETAGTAKEAGLPNITGSVAPTILTSTYTHAGALNCTNISVANKYTAGANGSSATLNIDASLSNPIYGNSDTVQPESLTVRFIIKAFDGQTADSALIDITQYAQRLEEKADINGSNLVYHKDVITTSGTYTAPVTALYKITVKGGGGGGGAGLHSSSRVEGGTGGGEGGISIGFEKLTAGQTASVVVGAGGAGGVSGSGSAPTPGGNSTVTVNNKIYTGGGGARLTGGSGDIPGANGTSGQLNYSSSSSVGGIGGGNGGGTPTSNNLPLSATNGGGGAGGFANASVTYDGGAGGNGYVWFEYYTPGA